MYTWISLVLSGISFDKRQTWKPHHQEAETRARRKLAGSTWGDDERTLRTVYEGAVRPHLEYSAAAWSSASKSTLQSVDKVQNQAMRLTTGAMKTIPISAMEKVTVSAPARSSEHEDPPTGREIQMSTEPPYEGKSGRMYT